MYYKPKEVIVRQGEKADGEWRRARRPRSTLSRAHAPSVP